MKRGVALLGGLLVTAVVPAASAQPKSRPPLSSPAVVAPPTWWRVLHMPDGRVFVTDGALSVDVALAKPADLPSEVLPAVSAKTIAGLLSASYDKESGLSDLRAGMSANTFTTPDGVLLNGNYVTFLRQAAVAARPRLRTRGATDPVVVAIDGRPVAVLMPLQPPR